MQKRKRKKIDVPATLREARKTAGLTQAELAERLGVGTQQQVQAWESGKVMPSAEVYLRWLAACGHS